MDPFICQVIVPMRAIQQRKKLCTGLPCYLCLVSSLSIHIPTPIPIPIPISLYLVILIPIPISIPLPTPIPIHIPIPISILTLIPTPIPIPIHRPIPIPILTPIPTPSYIYTYALVCKREKLSNVQKEKTINMYANGALSVRGNGDDRRIPFWE